MTSTPNTNTPSTNASTSNAPRVSFEMFPPTDSAGEAKLWSSVRRLQPLGPEFISVTYGAGGSTRDRTDRAVRRIHLGAAAPSAAHITCVDATRDEVDQQVQAWKDAGISRIVALRGDAPGGGQFTAHPQGYQSAADLVAGIAEIGGLDISVAAYPEVHPDAANGQADLDTLKRKIDAGASRALTQFFMEPDTFLRFRDRATAAGINVPIIPGIIPISHFGRISSFAKRCGTDVPTWLAELFEGLDDDAETRAMIAVSTACELCQHLRAEGVDDFHFFTLNRAELVYAICWRLGLRERLEQAA